MVNSLLVSSNHKIECSGKTENINMGEPRISETQIETGTAGNY